MSFPIQAVHGESILSTYCELGKAALERGEFKIAERMYQAALNEPAARRRKEKYLVPLLVNLARTMEGRKQFYKAKLAYIRALAHQKRYHGVASESVVEILLMLARVNAKQGLMKQSCEFIDEASQSTEHLEREEGLPLSAVLSGLMDELHQLFEQRGTSEQVQVLAKLKTRF